MIKIAFPMAASPALDFYTTAMLAKRHGFDGVELHAVKEPAKTREIFAGSRIEISALNLGNASRDLPIQIKIAQELHCPRIRIKSDSFFSRSGTITPQALDFLVSAGDQAAAASISILIENQPVQGSAMRLWHLLDRLNHPAIACCWNVATAVKAGDTPSVAVPTLNSRIHYVQSPVDNETVPVQKTLNRLRGIGFEGYLLVDCCSSSNQNAAELEQSLIRARSLLQQWQILPAAVG